MPIVNLENFGSLQILDKDKLGINNCRICGDLMKEPIQTFRGYAACSNCYYSALERSNGICPLDGEPITKVETFRDKAKEKEILNLKCYCVNKDKGCKWNGPIRALKKHDCKYEPSICPMCNEKVMPDNLTKHQTSECGALKSGRCFYHEAGCLFEAKTEAETADHMIKNESIHKVLETNYQNYKTLQRESELLKKYNQTLQQKICELEKTFSDFVEKTEKQIAQMATSQNVRTDQSNTNPKNHVTEKITQVEKSNAKNATNISDLDLRLQLHENAVYDGHLIWKVDNFRHRRNEAISGAIRALHSAPCFTGPYGYKFCLRLYLNGDGMGKDSYLSLFLVIMKSEYDNILEWPFTKKVKFTLINQQNRNFDIVERMVPNKDSSSFQKPRKEMNVASGIPMFVEIDRLEREGFVNGDSLFIDVQIA